MAQCPSVAAGEYQNVHLKKPLQMCAARKGHFFWFQNSYSVLSMINDHKRSIGCDFRSTQTDYYIVNVQNSFSLTSIVLCCFFNLVFVNAKVAISPSTINFNLSFIVWKKIRGFWSNTDLVHWSINYSYCPVMAAWCDVSWPTGGCMFTQCHILQWSNLWVHKMIWE